MDFIGTVCSNQLFIYEQNKEINSDLSEQHIIIESDALDAESMKA